MTDRNATAHVLSNTLQHLEKKCRQPVKSPRCSWDRLRRIIAFHTPMQHIACNRRDQQSDRTRHHRRPRCFYIQFNF